MSSIVSMKIEKKILEGKQLILGSLLCWHIDERTFGLIQTSEGIMCPKIIMGQISKIKLMLQKDSTVEVKIYKLVA